MVYVDAGNYLLTNNIVLGVTDSGSSTGGVVTIFGAGTNLTLLNGLSGSTPTYGFYLNNASYVLIRDLSVFNASQAVRIEGGANNEIRNCRLNNSTVGVVLSGGSGHSVVQSSIDHNSQQGVVGSTSPGLALTGNTIGPNGMRGVDLSYGCNSAVISGNAIFNSVNEGIYLYSSCAGVNINGNTITNNGASGVWISSCGSPVISGNTISRN